VGWIKLARNMTEWYGLIGTAVSQSNMVSNKLKARYRLQRYGRLLLLRRNNL
jgi:hypothetical protein